jgi:squalene-hopene/tetraprenyl-beta-curcumene cyclase
MKYYIFPIALILLFQGMSLRGAGPEPYLSLKLEMERAIERGNDYLRQQQNEAGFWNDAKYPAYTALALTAAMRSPSFEKADYINHGLAWLREQQKKDGGIYNQTLSTYNTSTSITALVSRRDPYDKLTILRARRFLIHQQTDWDTKGETDKMFDGGVGYGGTYTHSDLSNTHLVIESLKLSRHLAQETIEGKQPGLNWEAAIQFISRTQNLKATNDQPDISDDGSFNYFPGDSKAGYHEHADGTKTLRGYGSMSYAGLLSMIYADLDKRDPRVVAVMKWLGANYTVKENPGLGHQGLYYYYHAMAKALSAAKVEKLLLESGNAADWRKDISEVLLGNQREDGSWINEGSSRWWESDPILVTAYAVLTLEQIYNSIPNLELSN